MRFQHIARYVSETPWAILPEKLDEIRLLLSDRFAGIRATPEELAAFAGNQSPAQSQRGSVAVLPMRGVIAHRAGALDESSGGVSTEAFAKVYRQLMQDASISAIVLDVDSPGGAVAGAHELAQEMLAMRGMKPVVAVANSCMASCAYWLCAAAADEIVALPSATIGAIGVASIYVDDSKQREADGITVEVFTSGANKIDVLGLGPLSEEARARRQARVDEAGGWFRGDVAKGRGISVADVRGKYGEGSIFGAKEALAAGMIDRIGTLDDAIARLTGRKASGGGMRAEFHAEDETLAETEARAETPIFGQVADEDQARRLRLL